MHILQFSDVWPLPLDHFNGRQLGGGNDFYVGLPFYYFFKKNYNLFLHFYHYNRVAVFVYYYYYYY